jgi:hypothetical protein
MLVIPFALSDREYSIFVLLGPENLDRIKAYDPAEVSIPKMAASETTRGRTLRDVIIGYATDAEAAAILKPGADVGAVLRHLSRGFRYRPDRGDSDDPYKKA